MVHAVPEPIPISFEASFPFKTRSAEDEIWDVSRPQCVQPGGKCDPMTRSRIILLGVLSLIFTLFVLRWSASHGRLAQEITADDSAYFTDGLRRLNALFHGGIVEFTRYALRSPPHSPYSSLMAFLGFLILGVRDWVPYFTNVILVFLLLLLVDHLARKLDEGRRNALLLVTLAVPFSFTAVHDFRPDFAVALFTAIGVVCGLEWAVSQPPDSTSLQRAFIGGLPFGIAFVVKPSFFPHTAVLSMVPVMFKVMSWSLARSEQQQPITRLIPAGLSYLAGVLLLPLPFYVWNYLSILGYFLSNTGQGADAALWRLQGGAWSVFAIYTYSTGSGIAGMLGNFIFVFALLSVIGLAVFLANRNRREALVQAGVLTAIATSLAIMVYGRYSNSFFGLTFQILLLFGAIRGLGPHPPLGRWGNNLLFGGLLAFSLWNALVPTASSYARPLMGMPASGARHALHRIVDVIVENTSADFAAKNRRGDRHGRFCLLGRCQFV